jgi:hypothetical protein
MRSKNLIIGLLCLFVLIIVFTLTTKSQKPTETPKFEIIKVGTGATPKWSPDGTKLAFVYMMKLCVANVDGKGKVDTVAYLPRTHKVMSGWIQMSLWFGKNRFGGRQAKWRVICWG